MAHTKFRVEVLTPDGELFNEEVEMLSTYTTDGSIGILANHARLLAMLKPTELRLYRSESEIVRFAQAEGYMQVGENRALILVEEAYEPSALNAEELRERLSVAEVEYDEADEGSEKRRMALRTRRRLEAFLRIASASG
jgi:F-type H+-transporting ATPase subunit epsilon